MYVALRVFFFLHNKEGHVLRMLFSCRRSHQQKRTWSSSRIFGGHYLLNQKYVSNCLCSVQYCYLYTGWCIVLHVLGFYLASIYIKFSQFAGMRHVGHGYMKRGEEINVYIVIIHVHVNNKIINATISSIPQHWLYEDSRQVGRGLHE